MSVMFRVDANQQIGMGHLMRCLALAQLFESQQIETIFVVRAKSRPLCLSRYDWVGKIVIIPDSIQLENEPDWLASLSEFNNASTFVLDGYQFTEKYRKSIAILGKRFVLFDDNNNSGMLHSDVVINAAPNANTLEYELTAGDSLLCLGDAFRCLRQEFYQAPEVNWSERHSLTMVFGGSDPLDISRQLIEQLDLISEESDQLIMRVATGAAFGKEEPLLNAISKVATPVQHLPNCQDMAELFSYSSLVITAAGGSQFEAMHCYAPSVLVVVADNQLGASHQAATQGWCKVVDARLELNVNEMAKGILELWRNKQELCNMHLAAQKLGPCGDLNRLMDAIFARGSYAA